MGLRAAASGWQMSQAAFWGYFNPDTEKKRGPFLLSNTILITTPDF